MSVFPYSLFLIKHRTFSGWMMILSQLCGCSDHHQHEDTQPDKRPIPIMGPSGITVEQYCAFYWRVWRMWTLLHY